MLGRGRMDLAEEHFAKDVAPDKKSVGIECMCSVFVISDRKKALS